MRQVDMDDYIQVKNVHVRFKGDSVSTPLSSDPNRAFALLVNSKHVRYISLEEMQKICYPEEGKL